MRKGEEIIRKGKRKEAILSSLVIFLILFVYSGGIYADSLIGYGENSSYEVTEMARDYDRREVMPEPLDNVVASAKGDVNGDGIPDCVYLTGTQGQDTPFTENITLVIRDGKTGKFTRIPLEENAGYNPHLFLGDFTGDGVDDILIGIFSGGSGGLMYYYIYSFLNNNPRLLFDFAKYNEEYKYNVNYLNCYRVEVVSRMNSTRYIIDITQKGADYLNEIYDKKGRLIEPIEGFVNPISGLYPVDFDSNGVYELLIFQRISGRYAADALGYILNSLEWDNDRFVLFNQYTAIFGSQLRR